MSMSSQPLSDDNFSSKYESKRILGQMPKYGNLGPDPRKNFQKPFFPCKASDPYPSNKSSNEGVSYKDQNASYAPANSIRQE